MGSGRKIALHPVFRAVRIVLLALLVTITAVGILRWTQVLQRKDTLQRQREVLRQVLEQRGEAGLLELAGIPVNNIFYGDEGLTIFQGSLMDYKYSAEEMQNITIYELANKSVVHVATVGEGSLDSFLEALPVSGTGSGTIISTDGYILTNAHVVNGSKTLSIRLHDETIHEAVLTGMDLENDLAVLKIDAGDLALTPIVFGTATNLRVGQKVVAIGNPFGYDRTMTIGTVSGLGRPVRTDTNTIVNGMIQTDAAINPGNSGGPLLNGKGEMIGICTTIHSTTGGSQGIGFAVPVDTAVLVIPDLIKYGKVVRGWFDITMVQLDGSIVDYAGLQVSKGLLVSQVVPGGKAEKGGLKGGSQKVQYGTAIIHLGGDVIVEVNGKPVGEYSDLYGALVDTHPGQVVPVKVVRKGEERMLQIELVARPEKVEWTVR